MKFDKYKKLGDYHWREYRKQPIFRNHIDKIVQNIKGERVLDIGAGDGITTYLIDHKENQSCIGIDNEPVAVNIAQNNGAKVIMGDAYNIEFPDNYFDSVLMADVIEHLEKPEKVIAEVRRVLKKGGCLHITTPPKKQKGMHDRKYHYKEYTSQELIEFIEQFKFKINQPIEQNKRKIYAEFIKL